MINSTVKRFLAFGIVVMSLSALLFEIPAFAATNSSTLTLQASGAADAGLIGAAPRTVTLTLTNVATSPNSIKSLEVTTSGATIDPTNVGGSCRQSPYFWVNLSTSTKVRLQMPSNGAQLFPGKNCTVIIQVVTTIQGPYSWVWKAYQSAQFQNLHSTGGLAVTIDTTRPTITASRSPLPNSNGWNGAPGTGSYASPVVASFACMDSSGIASCTASSATATTITNNIGAPGPITGASATFTVEGASQSAVGNVVDKAGNTATTSMPGINIDLTPPTGGVSGVSPSVLVLGATSVRGTIIVSADVSDALSGVDSVTFFNDKGTLAAATIGTIQITPTTPPSTYSVSFDTTTAPDGTHTLSIRAVDRAGNQLDPPLPPIFIDNTPPVPTPATNIVMQAIGNGNGFGSFMMGATDPTPNPDSDPNHITRSCVGQHFTGDVPDLTTFPVDPAGSTYAPGSNLVSCTFTDPTGNSATGLADMPFTPSTTGAANLVSGAVGNSLSSDGSARTSTSTSFTEASPAGGVVCNGIVANACVGGVGPTEIVLKTEEISVWFNHAVNFPTIVKYFSTSFDRPFGAAFPSGDSCASSPCTDDMNPVGDEFAGDLHQGLIFADHRIRATCDGTDILLNAVLDGCAVAVVTLMEAPTATDDCGIEPTPTNGAVSPCLFIDYKSVDGALEVLVAYRPSLDGSPIFKVDEKLGAFSADSMVVTGQPVSLNPTDNSLGVGQQLARVEPRTSDTNVGFLGVNLAFDCIGLDGAPATSGITKIECEFFDVGQPSRRGSGTMLGSDSTTEPCNSSPNPCAKYRVHAPMTTISQVGSVGVNVYFEDNAGNTLATKHYSIVALDKNVLNSITYKSGTTSVITRTLGTPGTEDTCIDLNMISSIPDEVASPQLTATYEYNCRASPPLFSGNVFIDPISGKDTASAGSCIAIYKNDAASPGYIRHVDPGTTCAVGKLKDASCDTAVAGNCISHIADEWTITGLAYPKHSIEHKAFFKGGMEADVVDAGAPALPNGAIYPSGQASVQGDSTVWDLAGATAYVSSFVAAANAAFKQDLGDTAKTDLETAIKNAQSWFDVRVKFDDGIFSSLNSYKQQDTKNGVAGRLPILRAEWNANIITCSSDTYVHGQTAHINCSGSNFAANDNTAGTIWLDTANFGVKDAGEISASITIGLNGAGGAAPAADTGSFVAPQLTVVLPAAGTYYIKVDVPIGSPVEGSLQFVVS